MKFVFLSLVTFFVSLPAFAAEGFVRRACYAGCTFEGVQAAERDCNIAAQAINILSNERVQLVASCRADNGSERYCEHLGNCTFGHVVLQTQFYIH